MAKRKLQRFAENATFPHFFQPEWDEIEQGYALQGQWHTKVFENNHPIVLEVGCGKGEYTVALANRYPSKNFIGMDKKGARMWRGAKTSFEAGMKNVAFVRTRAEHIPFIFGSGEISEIWITFPEPQPRNPKADKRFTSPRYLARYASVMAPDGLIHLKTDNTALYLYTLEVLQQEGHQIVINVPDLYAISNDPLLADVQAVRTHYESIWLGQGLTIKYVCFRLVAHES